MLLGIFGLPGGAELVVIAGVVLLLFVPSLLFFGLGYMMGRKSTTTPGPGAHAGSPLPPDRDVGRDDVPTSDGTAGGDGSDA
jgi:hypothetical protein